MKTEIQIKKETQVETKLFLKDVDVGTYFNFIEDPDTVYQKVNEKHHIICVHTGYLQHFWERTLNMPIKVYQNVTIHIS